MIKAITIMLALLFMVVLVISACTPQAQSGTPSSKDLIRRPNETEQVPVTPSSKDLPRRPNETEQVQTTPSYKDLPPRPKQSDSTPPAPPSSSIPNSQTSTFEPVHPDLGMKTLNPALGDLLGGATLAKTIIDNPYKNYAFNYKGANHVHTTLSDGELPVDAVLSLHKSKGYRFVFLTDHNHLKLKNTPDIEGMLQFRNYDSFECGQKYSHHILVLGIDQQLVKEYHDTIRSDVDPDQNGTIAWDTGDCENVFTRIQYYDYVGMAVLAHPHGEHHDDVWGYGWSRGELLDTRNNYTGIEIFNSSEAGPKEWYEGIIPSSSGGVVGPDAGMKEPFCLDWWDEVLQQGRAAWGFGADDCHNPSQNNKSFNRAWIVVNSDLAFRNDGGMELDILRNIKAGNFYTVVRSPSFLTVPPGPGPAGNGPVLKITVDGQKIKVNTDEEGSNIVFVVAKQDGSLTKVEIQATQDGPVTKGKFNPAPQTATYTIDNTVKYVRVEVNQTRSDGEKYVAYSQPLFVRQQ